VLGLVVALLFLLYGPHLVHCPRWNGDGTTSKGMTACSPSADSVPSCEAQEIISCLKPRTFLITTRHFLRGTSSYIRISGGYCHNSYKWSRLFLVRDKKTPLTRSRKARFVLEVTGVCLFVQFERVTLVSVQVLT
jgi:hypothetical protein